jgi:hypothetical protein
MAETRIILDTNAYFRLAQSIHPLLSTAFGKQKYTHQIRKQEDEKTRYPRQNLEKENHALKNKKARSTEVDRAFLIYNLLILLAHLIKSSKS